MPPAFNVKTITRPFDGSVVDFAMHEGATLDDCLIETVKRTDNPPEMYRAAAVYVGDCRIPKSWWSRVRPNPGTDVFIAPVPQGGSVLLRLATTALSFAVPQFGVVNIFGQNFALGTALVKGAISIGSSLLSSSLSGAPKQSLTPNASNAPAPEARFSINGVRNEAKQYGVVPRIFGKVENYHPPLAAAPYTEVYQNEQFLRMLFCVGHGRVDVSDIKIGNAPIASLDDTDYVYHNGTSAPSLELFPIGVREETLSIQLDQGVYHQRTSEPNCREVILDVTFPRLFSENRTNGRTFSASVVFQVQYRATGSGSFVDAPLRNRNGTNVTGTGDFRVQAFSTSAVRAAVAIRFPSTGQWDFRIKKVSSSPVDSALNLYDTVNWTAYRSLDHRSPINIDNVALLEVRARASNQLQGVIDSLNLTAEGYVDAYNGSSWVSTKTRNPAWAYADALNGPVMARPVGLAKINAASLLDWANDCDANGWYFDGVLDFSTTVQSFLAEAANAGRASPAIVDGLYTVVVDKPKTDIVAIIGTRNAAGFEAVKTYYRRPHAVRVRYPRRLSGRQVAERIVYADGYSASNATLFEVLDLPWTSEDADAYGKGEFAIKVQELRPEVYTLTQPLEHIRYTRGDLVRLTYDVILVGQASAFIKSTTEDGSSQTLTVTLEFPVTMETGKTYAFRARVADAGTSSFAVYAVNTVVGTSATLTLTTPAGGATRPQPGQLVMFGESGVESAPMLVQSITPSEDLNAQITLVDEGAGVHVAGPVPPFDPLISLPVQVQRAVPADPIILSVDSDEAILSPAQIANLSAAIEIAFAPGISAANNVPPDRITVQYRQDGDTVWSNIAPQSASGGVAQIWPVVEGETYNLRLRAETVAGATSEWVYAADETVVGFSTLPPSVDVLLLDGTDLVWTYPAENTPNDFNGFELRRHFGDRRSWDDAQALHSLAIGTTRHPIDSLFGTGVQTLMLRGVDVAGNYSAESATVVIDLGDLFTDNLVLTQSEAPTFAGTKTDATVSSGVLQADLDANPLFWGQDTAPFWGLDTELFWSTITYKGPAYIAQYDPLESHVGAVVKLEVTAAGAYAIEYRRQLSPPFWNASAVADFWADDAELFWPEEGDSVWLPWPGLLGPLPNNADYYQFRWIAEPGTVRAELSQFDIIVDVQDISENFDDVAVAATGTVRLPITRTYPNAIAIVNVTLQDDGGSGFTARVMDKDKTLGPEVQVFDQTGARVAGLVDATVIGY